MKRPYPFDGFPEKGSDWREVEQVYDNVLGWLGRYRDNIAPGAVSLLQDILGVLRADNDVGPSTDPDGNDYINDQIANVEAKGKQAVKEAYQRCAAFATSEHLRLGKVNYTGAIESLMNCHTKFSRWASEAGSVQGGNASGAERHDAEDRG